MWLEKSHQNNNFSQSGPVLIRQFSKKLQSDPVGIRPKLATVLIQSDPVLIRAHLSLVRSFAHMALGNSDRSKMVL